MPTYVKTIIYQIICKDKNITDSYVGHSTNIKQRNIEHKYSCNNENSKSYNIKLYTFIRENGGWDNWEIIEIEEYPCDNKKQALCRENYWCFELKSSLNDIMPILNIQNIIDYKKTKSDENKLKTIEKLQKKKEERQKYLEDNKEQIKQQKIAVRREYEKKNRDKINADMREYNKNNKDKIKETAKKAYEKRKANGYYVKND
jgi:hypothetical protein